MTEEYLHERRAFLLAAQNRDGGWGYFPGKSSWVEPSVYASLALAGDPAAAAPCDRAFGFVRAQQMESGAWRPAPGADTPSWVTALAVTLHCARGVHDGRFERGAAWLAANKGADQMAWYWRLFWRIKGDPIEQDRSLSGWPWSPGTASWVEPTSHTLLALKKSAPRLKPGGWERVAMAERMMADRRAQDGGWNYGNRVVLGVTLPSYPEMTGIALVGLQGCRAFDLRPSLDLAARQWRETGSPLAKAWLAIALRNHGMDLPEPAAAQPFPDILLAALECLAAPGGGHDLLKPEARL